LNGVKLAHKLANIAIPAVITVRHIGIAMIVKAQDITRAVLDAIPTAIAFCFVYFNPFIFLAFIPFHG
jgi:hypothetical protein